MTGTLGVDHGGTGATTAASARTNLGTWSLISDSYNTIMPADGTTNGWYKFGTSNTNYGILPSASGGAGSGHNYIGTSGWYWKGAYIDQIYGNLTGDVTGNVSGSSGSCTGNAATATKSGISDIWLYPENSNEINFGGATSSTTIFIGYRAKDSRAIPTKFIFGGTTGTADLQAKQVYLGSGTSSYISSTTYTGTAANASAVPLTGVTGADDLKAIEALSGTSGFLKKTAANTWTLDTNTYLTSSTGVTSIEGKTGAVTRVDLGIVYSTDTPSSPTEGMIWLKPI